MEDFIVELPYIALHYLQHGSFAYAGDYHDSGQIDPRQPDVALHSDGTRHILSTADDSDGDGLTDAEEGYFGTQAGNPDSDADGIVDGAEFAKTFAAKIDSLPREYQTDGIWVKEYMQRGIETCAICGSVVNMGYLEVISSVTNDTLQIPYIGLHALHHGSFSYNGNVHNQGRVEPVSLAKILGQTPTAIESHQNQNPNSFMLLQNYPNPFSESNSGVNNGVGTQIQYQIGGSEPVHVELKVFNILGQTVKLLVNDSKPVGQHQVMWDGRDKHGEILPAGLYLYRLRAGDFSEIKKALLTR